MIKYATRVSFLTQSIPAWWHFHIFMVLAVIITWSRSQPPKSKSTLSAHAFSSIFLKVFLFIIIEATIDFHFDPNQNRNHPKPWDHTQPNNFDSKTNIYSKTLPSQVGKLILTLETESFINRKSTNQNQNHAKVIRSVTDWVKNLRRDFGF